MNACLEKKLTLAGEVKTYACELVRLEPGFGVLKHVIDRHYDVGGIRLVPGDATIALYWTDRPYTLYTWRIPRLGGTICYFNIADSVSLRPDEFRWRDLVVDILVDVNGLPRVLDEHELPAGLDGVLATRIQKTKEDILARFQDILKEVRHLASGCT